MSEFETALKIYEQEKRINLFRNRSADIMRSLGSFDEWNRAGDTRV